MTKIRQQSVEKFITETRAQRYPTNDMKEEEVEARTEGGSLYMLFNMFLYCLNLL